MENAMSSVDQVYKNRSQFVLIGLTGRTGSGCTSSSNILGQTFKDIKAPKACSTDDNEERKYRIVHSYCERNWLPFQIIHIKDIITSFIIENSYEDFLEFLKKNEKECRINYASLENNLEIFIKEDYQKIYALRTQLIEDRLAVEQKSENRTSSSSDIRNKLYDFYFNIIPPFSTSLKKILNRSSENLYTTVYQLIGNNLRSSGSAFDNQYKRIHIYRIAVRVNKVIKIIRRLRGKSEKTLIAIDAFRNPFEISFFRERYAAFYLIAINTEVNTRVSRLQKTSNINNEQLKSIDREYDKKLKGNEVFYSQDIGSCIQLADIHIHNPEISLDNFSTLKKQLIYYTTLIIHPGMVPPSHLERCMQMAFNAKLNSGCLSRQVGAVITDKYSSIKAVGWNSVPEGHVPCLLRSADDLLNNEDQNAYSEYESNDPIFRKIMECAYGNIKASEKCQSKLKGLNISYCFKDIQNSIDGDKNQVHTRALHAEENAFLQITKYGGTGIKGGMLFVTASPCELCSKKAYQLGISTIVYIDPYPGIAKDHILSSGKNRPKLQLFSGAIGRAYYQLYEPLLSYKDELEMILEEQNQ
jgi:deoxycytidylate deaminase/dephospho-CoA kinase